MNVRRSYDLPSQDRRSGALKTVTFKWARGELIAKGSYGRVYMGFNVNSGEVIAVKQVEKSQDDRSDIKKRTELLDALRFEGATLKDLAHPNIVQYLGFEDTAEALNIFLEYVPGGTIGSCVLKHGRFEENVTRWFTAQILDGLDYIHSQGFLHRDLKGDNILVETSGQCKISDFGISKRQDMEGRAFTELKGTVYWMAPEVINLNKDDGYDTKVDIWSTGCVVLEMWTGGRPWAGFEQMVVLFKLHTDKLPPPIPAGVSVSETAMDFYRECFNTNPRERPSAAELREHPYLTLPYGWCFQLADIEQRRRSPDMRTQNSSRRDPSVSSNRRKRVQAESQPLSLKPKLQIRSPPPLVYITPPGSPATASISTGSSLISTPACVKKRKSFRVVNPDPSPDDNQERLGFMYDPPPLPDSKCTLRPTIETFLTICSSDSETETSTGIWKKPLDRISCLPMHHRPSIIGAGDVVSWAPRPRVRDVFSNLDEFFPRVDLDKAIVAHRPTDGLRRTRSMRMAVKSRMTGKERHTIGITKFWGHKVVEITHAI
ncbi:unnamed protein product [Mycena citricolor]|uniref:Protein kinase domain-containing protein n=1 Tax=Mycena citricolor TaxID=2018698 RepID=A0AAD2K773_9AGAR|nr:unnamed protein product [Mycena citricolor]